MTKTLPLVALAALAALATPAAAQDQFFRIVNNSPRALVAFYATPTIFETWGEDLLGEHIIASGEAMEIWIADNQTTCRYDVRFVFDGAHEVESVHNICELGEFVLR